MKNFESPMTLEQHIANASEAMRFEPVVNPSPAQAQQIQALSLYGIGHATTALAMLLWQQNNGSGTDQPAEDIRQRANSDNSEAVDSETSASAMEQLYQRHPELKAMIERMNSGKAADMPVNPHLAMNAILGNVTAPPHRASRGFATQRQVTQLVRLGTPISEALKMSFEDAAARLGEAFKLFENQSEAQTETAPPHIEIDHTSYVPPESEQSNSEPVPHESDPDVISAAKMVNMHPRQLAMLEMVRQHAPEAYLRIQKGECAPGTKMPETINSAYSGLNAAWKSE